MWQGSHFRCLPALCVLKVLRQQGLRDEAGQQQAACAVQARALLERRAQVSTQRMDVHGRVRSEMKGGAVVLRASEFAAR